MIDDLNALLHAELRYAYFNARRTASEAAPTGIVLADSAEVPHVLDSGRPDNVYYNRAVVPPTCGCVAEVLDTLSAAVQAIELLFPQQTETNFASLLNARFRPVSSLCYLEATPSAVAGDSQRVVELGPDERDEFFDLLELSGVSYNRDRRNRTAGYYCTSQFRCFVAHAPDGKPAGWGTMFVDSGTAFLANAFTLLQYRASGIHSALLAARLEAAHATGLKVAYTDVEPGSQSHRNCRRSGFDLLSVNSVWTRTRENQ